jgi:hypothetical protein
VLADDTSRPLRRARITLSALELGGERRNASTDTDGTFEFTELPAGRYMLSVTRSGHLPLRYGQRRPLESGKPLQVLDKQVVDHVDFSLPRMGRPKYASERRPGSDDIEKARAYSYRSYCARAAHAGKRELPETAA